MPATYEAYPYELGHPIPPTHGVYQLRKAAVLIATCAALTPDGAAGYFHGEPPAGLGIDPVGADIVRVSSRYSATVIGE